MKSLFWSTLSPLGWTPSQGLAVWTLHVLSVFGWVPSRLSNVLPQSRDTRVRLIGARRCERACVWLSASIHLPCDELLTCQYPASYAQNN